MVIKIVWRLGRQVLARRGEYKISSLLLGILRCTRIFAYYEEHKRFFASDIYRNYLAPVSSNYVLRHLTHRAYLIGGLSTRERVRCLLTHYQFEDRVFNHLYKCAVYLEDGIFLWQRSICGSDFAIKLAMSIPGTAEGELTVTLLADGECLHRISFSWIEGSLVGLPCPIVPFLARNQGAGRDSKHAVEAFKKAFPKNSPRFFCFAAVQGIAEAVGLTQVIGVKSHRQVIFSLTGEHFTSAYDVFWKDVGGIEVSDYGYLIELPFYRESSANITSKYGQQAAMRRLFWKEISASAQNSLKPHVGIYEGQSQSSSLHEDQPPCEIAA